MQGKIKGNYILARRINSREYFSDGLFGNPIQFKDVNEAMEWLCNQFPGTNLYNDYEYDLVEKDIDKLKPI
jgi:hypothetical protein